jgi:ferredoxin
VTAAAPLTIDRRCTACGLCLATCPTHALRRAPGRPRLLAVACTRCLACIEVCPVDAITESPLLGPGPDGGATGRDGGAKG